MVQVSNVRQEGQKESEVIQKGNEYPTNVAYTHCAGHGLACAVISKTEGQSPFFTQARHRDIAQRSNKWSTVG